MIMFWYEVKAVCMCGTSSHGEERLMHAALVVFSYLTRYGGGR